MPTHHWLETALSTLAAVMLTGPAPVQAGPGALPDNDILMKAVVDELHRSMDKLALEDLPRPFFIQYQAQDRISFTMRAANGGLLRSDDGRTRYVASRVRVGSYKLDNTNVSRSFGGRAGLPLDDDYTAIRHALWSMTDKDYKRAIEVFTRKEAYLKQKNVADRPDDFSAAQPVSVIEPSAEIAFDRAKWEDNLRRLSGRFKRYPAIQASNVTFFAGAANQWIVNSEGTRLRTGDTGAYLEFEAEMQAEDGMRLSDSRSYVALFVEDLPPVDRMLDDIDKMCARLIALSKAPILEHYSGPVLFEPLAAGKAFSALLAESVCARPTYVGSGGWDERSFEKKIGRRILPRSFHVYDDPREETFEGTLLAGSYTFDDEGVPPQRVSLVEKGVLKTLLASRAPTRKIRHTTGHGRNPGYGDAEATIGCLYLSDDDGLSREELGAELIRAARDEGLPFGLRIASMAASIPGELGTPIYAYKVFVEDGREELVRGLEFTATEPRAMKRILASGTERKVYNSIAGVAASIIAPAVIFEELELNKVEEEFDKRPILKSPAQRALSAAAESR